MSCKKCKQIALSLILTVLLFVFMPGCTLPQAGAGDVESLTANQSEIYGDWESSSDLVEEQLMRGSGTESSGVPAPEREEQPTTPRFRDTSNGEPVAIHQFINRVLVDDEYAGIILHAKTADAFGDAGYTLMVENRYIPLTSVGYDNYMYITPVMGTWTVNGVPMDPRTEETIYPKYPKTIYLYFDELDSIEQLVEVKGEFEIYLISDWWNPVSVHQFYQP